jgi:hypothetical protein
MRNGSPWAALSPEQFGCERVQYGLVNQPVAPHIWFIAGNDRIGRWRQRDTTVLPLVSEEGHRCAEACQCLADSAISEKTREIMVYVAARWLELADEAEARTPKHRLTSPLSSST